MNCYAQSYAKFLAHHFHLDESVLRQPFDMLIHSDGSIDYSNEITRWFNLISYRCLLLSLFPQQNISTELDNPSLRILTRATMNSPLSRQSRAHEIELLHRALANYSIEDKIFFLEMVAGKYKDSKYVVLGDIRLEIEQNQQIWESIPQEETGS